MTTKQEIAKEIDVDPQDIEVLEADLQSKNEAVASVAVVKVTHKDEPTDEDNDQTKVLAENVVNVLGEEKAKELADELPEIADTLEATQEKAKEVADNAKAQVSDKIDTVKDKAQEGKAVVQEKVADVKAQVGDKIDSVKDQAEQLAKDTKEQANDKVDAVKDKAEQVVADITDKAEEGKATVQDKVADVKEQVADTVDNVKDKAEQLVSDTKEQVSDKVDTAKDKAEQLVADVTDKAEEGKTAVQEKVADVKEQVNDKIDSAKDKAHDLQEKASEKVAGLKELAEEKIASAKNYAGELLDGLKDKVHSVKETAEEKIAEVKDSANETLDSTKDTLSEKKEQAETFLDEQKEALDSETEALQDRLQAAKEELLAKKDELLDKFEEANASYDEDKHGKGLAGKLTAVGAYFASVYASKDKTHNAVDLSQDNFAPDAFKRQGKQFGQELLGAKAVAATTLLGKFVSDEKMNAVSEAIYSKLADWASNWASSDLAKDDRFARVRSLSDAEREQFAEDISNQNRALATLGGVTGLMGLKGVIADTAWLLMVSLKSVYQLSMIYDKPLTGKEGSQLAYGILSQCDLDKLQEKQVVMTALALGNSVLKNAQGTSLIDELKNIGEKYQNRSYSEQFDVIARYVNLDKFNFAWLHYVLPIGASAVAVHYNNELIEEVLGVAKATFAGQTVSGLLEDKRTISLPTDTTDNGDTNH